MPELPKHCDWRLKYGFHTHEDLIFAEYEPLRKFRLPNADDQDADWVQTTLPSSIDTFLGNNEAVAFLRDLQQKKDVPSAPHLLITGPSGTGKTSYVHLLKQILTSQPDQMSQFNTNEMSENELFSQISSVLDRPAGLFRAGKHQRMHYIVVDHLDGLSSTSQKHHLVPLLNTARRRKDTIFFLLSRADITNIPKNIQQLCAHKIQLMPLSPLLLCRKLLSIATKEKVGYNREGIEAIVEHFPDQIVASIRLLHRVFVTYHYHFHAKLSSLDQPQNFESYEIGELYRSFAKRCSRCTLYPPCAHVSLPMMIRRVEETWSQYPNREGPSRPFQSNSLDSKSGSVPLRDHRDARWYHKSASKDECISFITTGICSSVTSRGRCQFKHPPNLHAIDKRKLVVRCSQHTLPVPCFHCDQLLRYAKDRFEAAKSELDQTKMELARLDDTRFRIKKKYQKARDRDTKRAIQEAINKSDQDISRLLEILPILEQQLCVEVAALNIIQQKVPSGQTKGSRVS